MVDANTFRQSANAVKEAFMYDSDFRSAVIASIMSVMNELKGSHSDEDVAIAIAERLFSDD